jgi:hypothetical protein
VERGNAVTGLEFPDFAAHAVDDAGDVIARVGVVVRDEFGDLPIRSLVIVLELSTRNVKRDYST